MKFLGWVFVIFISMNPGGSGGSRTGKGRGVPKSGGFWASLAEFVIAFARDWIDKIRDESRIRAERVVQNSKQISGAAQKTIDERQSKRFFEFYHIHKYNNPLKSMYRNLRPRRFQQYYNLLNNIPSLLRPSWISPQVYSFIIRVATRGLSYELIDEIISIAESESDRAVFVKIRDGFNPNSSLNIDVRIHAVNRALSTTYTPYFLQALSLLQDRHSADSMSDAQLQGIINTLSESWHDRVTNISEQLNEIALIEESVSMVETIKMIDESEREDQNSRGAGGAG